ncbi:type II toxin-antitoxin system Phd/YefM family antitoxin [Allorhizocola rhizosphaerae]|uniref:type II toxin-antitoxin system Phd/YefM family antitoxin n=1 Tax=Allorhizocola rhizosphaerae TaxID=1872709 RepID=UPI001B8D5D78|nr:type II toxin-antitoxin system Phd/YefM family antitoxin [Allorhizocola rhizosphaerae]
MSTHSLKDLRANLGHAVREVAYSGQEAIITDSGTEIAAIISMDDYERLHEHADVADALYLREKRSVDFETVSMAEMLEMLGVADVSRGVAA